MTELTGPELYAAVGDKVADAHMETPGSPMEQSDLAMARLMATQANTAALVMFAGLYADAHGIRSRELEAWAEKIPSPPLVECWGMDIRRPECAERHTEDCAYTDPIPEPKPPVLYVQRFTGKQGRVLEVGSEKGKVRVKVQWFAPGAEPVWIDLDVLKIIPAEEVDRCPNGQTGDECGSGENQCEPCRQAEDTEGDEIEESMGLR